MLAEETEAEVNGAAKSATLRKKEFVARVTTLSGRKKQDVREITEAVLAVLGEALSKGEELNLPPLGKAKVNRQRDLTSGEMMIVKLRRAGAKETGTPPLADDEE
ncbi:MAG: HU family DNA-binding protein [Paracoccaceae bacterium]|nr:HU family DNA-binding protein [Paracoccaceae bacterium]